MVLAIGLKMMKVVAVVAVVVNGSRGKSEPNGRDEMKVWSA